MPSDRKRAQRERLLNAMTEVVARDGYDAASIARVIAAAGVSRRTFYEHFRDKEDCFLAALLAVQERLRADLEGAMTAAPPGRACRAALEAVLEFATAHSAQARVLTSAALAAGPRALELRDRGLAQLAHGVEERYALLAPYESVPDLAPAALLGGVYRMIAVRLLRDQADLAKSLAELLAWVASYERPLREHRWRALEPLAHPAPPAQSAPLLPPLAAPHPEGRVPTQQLLESQRQRVLFAVAQLAVEKGYRAMTVADIQRHAGIDAEAFRRLFAGKREVFAAVQEERIQHVTAVTAGAFFAADTWPERIWEAARAFAGVLEQNPAAAHVGFVEVHAAGARAVQRNDELVLAFTLFLQQGYEYQRPGAPVPTPAPSLPAPPSRLALEAIAATNFEIVYHQIRASRSPRLTGLVAHVTFLCLAPFLGAAAANDFVEGQLESGKPRKAASPNGQDRPAHGTA